MPALVSPIPSPVGDLGPSTLDQYVKQDFNYAYALAGIPFLSGANDDMPYTERMAEVRKEQFDNFAEPGEQSLQGWWLRSQSTFTGGAGVLYQDPDNDNQFNYRFADSLGIDPWTAGNVKLLRRTHFWLDSGIAPNVLVRGFVDPSGADAFWQSSGATLTKMVNVPTVVPIPAGGTIHSLTSTGYTYIFSRSDGVWKGTDAGAPTQISNTPLLFSNVEFVKDRLIVTNDNAVHQTTLTSSGALPTATYTHQDPNWRWKSITDGPNAIYIAGDSDTTSQIHKFTVVDQNGLPVLRWAGVTATMPAGEIIRTIYSYVGTFVGIATNKGFRVGEIDTNGDIIYGPLLFEPDGGCRGIAGNDRFMWTGSTAAHDGASGLFRIDLGNQIQEQTTRAVRYAYARDIYAEGNGGAITSLTMFGSSDQKVYSIQDSGGFLEQPEELLPTGYLTTGRIRFNTEEPKLYKFYSVRTPVTLDGDVAVTILSQDGGEFSSIVYGPSAPSGTKDVGIEQPFGPQNWIALRFDLTRGDDQFKGAIINGWQIKALPGSIRQRVVTVPLLLFNYEKDSGGNRVGHDGYARERFEQFKAVARAGDVILFQSLEENISAQVVIEDWEYQQTTAPFSDGGALGGYLTVRMRTVAEST